MAEDPDPRHVSDTTRSHHSMDLPIAFKDGSTDSKLEKTSPSDPRFVSIKSGHSMGLPMAFKGGSKKAKTSEESIESDRLKDFPITFKDESSVDDCEPKQDPGHSGAWSRTELDTIFKQLEEDIVTFVKDELKRFHTFLCSDYPECLEREEEAQEQSNQEAFLNITLNLLKRMKQELLAECLLSKSPSGVCQSKLKSRLKQRFSCVSEGISKQGKQTPLNQIFTALYITEGGASEVNQEHEIGCLQPVPDLLWSSVSSPVLRVLQSDTPGSQPQQPPGFRIRAAVYWT